MKLTSSAGTSYFSGEYAGSGDTWALWVGSYGGYSGLTFSYGRYGSYTVGITTGNYLYTGGWIHIAVSRSGTTWRIFINGVSQSLTTYNEGRTFDPSVNLNNTTAIRNIGLSQDNSTGGMNGYISDMRIVVGTAIYTYNFTPPTAPLTAINNTSLLLSMTNGSIYDLSMMNDLQTVGNAKISTTNKIFGTGSIYFDGINSGLVGGKNNPWILFGTTNFTIDFWVYFNTTPGLVSLVNFRGGTSANFEIAHNSDSTGLRVDFGSSTIISTNYHPNPGSWYNVSLVRSNGKLTLYANGNPIGSTSSTYNATYNGSGVEIGQGHGWYLNGYIDNLNITRGI